MSSTAGAIEQGYRAARDSSAVRRLFAVISITLFGLLTGLAIVLVVRRLSGALVSPLPSFGLLLAAAAIESAVLVYRFSSPGTAYSTFSTQYLPRWPRSLPPRAVFSLAIPGLAALAALSSLTMQGTPALGLILAWLLLISAESIQWLLYIRSDLANDLCWTHFRRATQSAAEVEHPEIPLGLVQQLTRTLEGNRESIHALVRAEIGANDRLAVVHLSFCPPLAAPPQLSAHPLDADEADVRITQAETFGARLEVRLPLANDTPRTVIIEVFGAVTAPKTV